MKDANMTIYGFKSFMEPIIEEEIKYHHEYFMNERNGELSTQLILDIDLVLYGEDLWDLLDCIEEAGAAVFYDSRDGVRVLIQLKSGIFEILFDNEYDRSKSQWAYEFRQLIIVERHRS